MSEAIVSIQGVSKHFGAIRALDNISIDINPGEIFALLGPSGCGKSTLLRVISGFEVPTEGRLIIDGQEMSKTPPNKRPVNMVFQSYAVFPHMSVADNVAYGLKMDKVPREEIDERVDTALTQVHLDAFKTRMPDQLSGGQRQRVALARALVKQPRVLLLDEPLSALDAKLRDAMRLELVKLQETVGITFIIVTHDQSEALAMADRVAVLDGGQLKQIATPEALYQQPVDAFVADFIGKFHAFDVVSMSHDNLQSSSGSVEISGSGSGPNSASASKSTITVEAAGLGQIHCKLMDHLSLSSNAEDHVVGIRPENIKVSVDNIPADHVSVTGKLGDIAFQGQFSIIEILLDDGNSLSAVVDNEHASHIQQQAATDNIVAHWEHQDMMLLPKRQTNP